MKKGDMIKFQELSLGFCPVVFSEGDRVGVKVFISTGPIVIYLDRAELITRNKKRVRQYEGQENHFFCYEVVGLPEATKQKWAGVFYGS